MSDTATAPALLSSQTVDMDWEEWDGKSPFWHHCLAGSMAGVAEHTLVYPIDTIRTHIQACAACRPQNAAAAATFTSSAAVSHRGLATASSSSSSSSSTSMWRTMRRLVTATNVSTETALSEAFMSSSSSSTFPSTFALSRLWRGVETMLFGCIPAHALYFGTYEGIKLYFGNDNNNNNNNDDNNHNHQKKRGEMSFVTSLLAGGAATVAHDVIMTPLDTLKQRLQLGHYGGVLEAFRHVLRHEGSRALFCSLHVTLLTNIPYGMVMMSVKEHLEHHHVVQNPIHNTLLASSVAGATAAAVTTPLDRCKTALQIQQLGPACRLGACPKVVVATTTASSSSFPTTTTQQQQQQQQRYCWKRAARTIWQQEGHRGFVRGMVPRVLSHTPAVAISWTSYETFQQWLAA